MKVLQIARKVAKESFFLVNSPEKKFVHFSDQRPSVFVPGCRQTLWQHKLFVLELFVLNGRQPERRQVENNVLQIDKAKQISRGVEALQKEHAQQKHAEQTQTD